MKCVIVLPCFNEEKNVKPLIYSIDHVLKTQIPYKIIAVNDGSHDRTAEVLRNLSAEYPVKVVEHSFNMGLGAALRTGLLTAAEEALDEDFVVVMDSDNTHDPKHVLDMLHVSDKASIIVGSRYVKGGRQLNVPFHRIVLSRMINILVSKSFQLTIKDTTSGYRCFKGYLIKRVCATFRDKIIESEGFVASLELLLKTLRIGGVAVEIPILLDYGKKEGKSKMSLFSTIISYLALLFKCKRMNE